jgi:SAM-dependent methyltransferase
MILDKLVRHHFKHGDDSAFYLIQARDAIRWIEAAGVPIKEGRRVLDIGCGHGIFGGELMKRGCTVTFADYQNLLFPEISSAPFRQVDLDKDDISKLGQYDLVVCSNVLEHLGKPQRFIHGAGELLAPGGQLYLSWTNWLSPWGGHEFSPWHYFGPKLGCRLYDKVTGKKRIHTPFVDLFPTYIGDVLKQIRQEPHLQITKIAPRYYTELGFLMSVPVAREFLAWNCAMLIGRK